MNKKILVLGASGAMAHYLIPELLKMGYSVHGVSLDELESDNPNLTYEKANALDINYLTELLKQNFDGIVDFMVYNDVNKFVEYRDLFLKNTQHYLFFSSYRVYAESVPTTEESPRLFDVSTDTVLLNSNDYCIYKAQEEDIMRQSATRNYTILRPAITFSKRRFQLCTLEAAILVHRMKVGKTVILPEEAMDIQATLSWAGDVAKMIARLLFNDKAYGETYSVCTNEHHTWREFAEMYKEIGGLSYITVPARDYVRVVSNSSVYGWQQLMYDRCLNRVMDNSKILRDTGLTTSDLTPVREALKMEYDNIQSGDIGCNVDVDKRMDDYLNNLE